jgi:predicted nuclease of predicted toxin-antitoxin system
MRFLADMCVDVRVVKWLHQKGHEATHLRDEGLHRMPNGEIFRKAINEDRVVITFDLDFAEIAALTEGKRRASSYFALEIREHPM